MAYDDGALVVGLEAVGGGAVGGGEVLEPPAQGLVVLPAVDPRLTLAQQVQVGPIAEEDFHMSSTSNLVCTVVSGSEKLVTV
jgi:hypothetical protein